MGRDNYCHYCGMCFTNESEDIAKHKRIHERKMLAEKIFGHIATYDEREYLKDKAHKDNTGHYMEDWSIGGKELTYYAHWSRSIEGCGYDLKHPTLQEYAIMRETNSELLNGSYVNMKKYKECLNSDYKI